MSQLTFRLAATLALASALLLAGCTSDGPIVLPGPAPTTAPVFATDEDALAAAEVAYGEYLKVIDEILADGGKDGDRLLKVATEDVLRFEQTGFDRVLDSGHRSVGHTKFDSMVLQQYEPLAQEGEPMVVVYVCDNLSEVDVVDATGKSVVEPGRKSRIPFEVSFDLTEESALIVSASEGWTGEDFCD